MSVMLLSDCHIATLAHYVACKISGDVCAGQYVAQRLHIVNVREFNRYNGLKKRSHKINLNITCDFTASECAALAECWKYNAGQSPEYYILAAMLDSAFSGVVPSDNVWSI